MASSLEAESYHIYTARPRGRSNLLSPAMWDRPSVNTEASGLSFPANSSTTIDAPGEITFSKSVQSQKYLIKLLQSSIIFFLLPESSNLPQ